MKCGTSWKRARSARPRRCEPASYSSRAKALSIRSSFPRRRPRAGSTRRRRLERSDGPSGAVRSRISGDRDRLLARRVGEGVRIRAPGPGSGRRAGGTEAPRRAPCSRETAELREHAVAAIEKQEVAPSSIRYPLQAPPASSHDGDLPSTVIRIVTINSSSAHPPAPVVAGPASHCPTPVKAAGPGHRGGAIVRL